MKILTETDCNVFIKKSLPSSYYDTGLSLLKSGKVCLVILAGDQGTRLGYDGPKGLFQIPGIGTLFEIFMGKIKTLETKIETTLKVFVMTSEFTHEETYNFISKNRSYKNVSLFTQDSFECIDINNNLIYDKNGPVRAPNGNGGVFKASRAIDLSPYTVVNVVSVDNILAEVFDPIAIGVLAHFNYEMLSKAVRKRKNENTGVFIIEKYITVAEYSEKKVEEGLSNICNHYFTTEFMERLQSVSFEVHFAFKKIPFLLNGKIVKPEKENGYKKELFVFDAHKYTKKAAIMVVDRENEFSVLKNGLDKDVDNVNTCVRDYLRFIGE